MKNFIKYIGIVMFASFVFYSCSTNELDIEQTPKTTQQDELKQFNATIAEFTNVYEPQTRSVINDTDPSNLQLVWASNDTIGIFPDQGFQVAFPMVSGAGAKSASFNGGGWGLKSASSYSAYFPLIGQFYLDKTKIPLSLLGQAQTGNGSHAHVGTFDYMSAINSNVDEYGAVSFNFQPLVCISRQTKRQVM